MSETNATTENTPSDRERIEPVLILKASDPFLHLDAEHLLPLARRSRLVERTAGALLATPDACFERTWFLQSGSLRFEYEQRTTALAPGPAIGLAHCLAATPAGAALSVAEHSVLLEVERHELLAAQEESFPLQQAIVTAIARTALEARAARGRSLPRAPRRSQARPGETDLASRIRLLHAAEILGEMRIHTLGRLALDSQLCEFEARQTLWERGESSGHALLVVDGEIERTGAQSERRVAFGDVIGLTESFARLPRHDDATAVTGGIALRIELEKLYDAMEDDAEVAVDLVHALAVNAVRECANAATEAPAGDGGPGLADVEAHPDPSAGEPS